MGLAVIHVGLLHDYRSLEHDRIRAIFRMTDRFSFKILSAAPQFMGISALADHLK